MRDTQRSKVYAAERAAFENLPIEKFESVKDVERFLKYIWKLKRVQNEWFSSVVGVNPPRVGDGRGCRRALACGAWEIKLPKWARQDWVAVHELAHIIHHRSGNWRKTEAAHGWQFCAIYLKLVLYVLGREKHDALKAAFKAHKVRFTEPRKRNLTDEQRQALADRLAAYRKAA